MAELGGKPSDPLNTCYRMAALLEPVAMQLADQEHGKRWITLTKHQRNYYRGQAHSLLLESGNQILEEPIP